MIDLKVLICDEEKKRLFPTKKISYTMKYLIKYNCNKFLAC